MPIYLRAIVIKAMIVIAAALLSLQAIALEKHQRDFKRIVSSGELRVGVSLFPPWVMRAKDGQLIGSEIDMANRLASDMGVKPVIALYDWEQLIAALEKGEIDVIVSGMAIKPRRALRVNFSRPYGDAGIGLVTNSKLTASFKSVDDLKKPSVTIGTLAETVSADVAKRLFSAATIKYYPSQQEAEQALLKGELHAMIAANPMPKFLALRHPDKVDVPVNQPLMSFKEGMAINKGDVDFLNFLDSWVVAHTADAWLASTRRYWLETLDWQEQVQ
jgi:polar amino acid transport system substrate-binding protein